MNDGENLCEIREVTPKKEKTKRRRHESPKRWYIDPNTKTLQYKVMIEGE